jgi:hypothetical protein
MLAELPLQAQCFQWHWNNFPKERQMMFHCNNKAANAIEGNKFKAMGVVKGVSDLIYICKDKVVFIEMKTEKGVQRPDQKTFQDKVQQLGHEYWVIRNLEDFKKLIYGNK